MDVIPDDLLRCCLLRVPYSSHNNLKAVCRSWKVMLSSPSFYVDIKICGASEHLLCFIQMNKRVDILCAVKVYDPVTGTSEMLPPIHDPDFVRITPLCRCAAVNGKLLLIGGFYHYRKRVYIYDFVSATWTRGADMPIARYSFGCSVSSANGLVYVAGGIDDHGTPLASAEVYNVAEDNWDILPPMNQQHGQGCHGVFMQGKFMVLGGGQFNRDAEVFDPTTRRWRRCEDSERLSTDVWRSCGVVSFSGELYRFTKEEVIKYDAAKSVWTPVAFLPQHFVDFPCATQWRHYIFVSGTATHTRVSYLFNPSVAQWTEVNGVYKEGSTLIKHATVVEI